MNKVETEITTIDEYIKSFSNDLQPKLTELRNLIKHLVPQAEETLSYKMPTFKLNGKAIAYFAAFKNHIGFYPFPSGVEKFKKETSEYVTSKGTIQFPIDTPLPLNLIKKIVEFRVEENLKKGNSGYSKRKKD